jgi:predicted SAM-dependent methyltransferase
MNKIYPSYSEPKFLNQLLFEINSWIGRKFYKKSSRFIPTKFPFLIDIGVGKNYTEGWTHVDFFRNRIRKFWKPRSKNRKPEVEMDLRYLLKCPSNVADGVYTGHTLEHLYPNHAFNLLKEIFRILKPGSWLRINIPDLKKAIEFYNGKIQISEWDQKYKADVIGNLTQNHNHHSVWDAELLSSVLKTIGFINIYEVEFGKTGKDSRLVKEEEIRKYETLVIEAQKPINFKDY